MEPFTYTLGTKSRTFRLEEDGYTVVIEHRDTADPRGTRTQVEQCENESEAQAVVTKMVFDMERGGWQTDAELRTDGA